MMEDLHSADPYVRELCDQAHEILGFDLMQFCFHGPAEELRQTRITQPALFVHGYVMHHLLREHDVTPLCYAGHSLGEFTAFAAAGALSFADGLRLVKVRSEAMNRVALDSPGAMAAIIGKSLAEVEAFCAAAAAAGYVTIANYNSPAQFVISGSAAGVEEAMRLATAAKARLVVKLHVSGAFHSALMEPARQELAQALADAPIRLPDLPVYCNVTAAPAGGVAEIRRLLEEQLVSPVRWSAEVERMAADGVEEFVELGPGNVLGGLLRKINPHVGVRSLKRLEDLNHYK